MFKRVLSLLLAFCVAFTALAGITARAESPYYIDGTAINRLSSASGNGWDWDKGKLTLFGTELDEISLPENAKIYVYSYNEVDKIDGVGLMYINGTGFLKATSISTVDLRISDTVKIDAGSIGDNATNIIDISGGYITVGGTMKAKTNVTIDNAYVKANTVETAVVYSQGGYLECGQIAGSLTNNNGVVKVNSSATYAVTGNVTSNGGVCIFYREDGNSPIGGYVSLKFKEFEDVKITKLYTFRTGSVFSWNFMGGPLSEAGIYFDYTTVILAKEAYSSLNDYNYNYTETTKTLDGTYIHAISNESALTAENLQILGGSYVEQVIDDEETIDPDDPPFAVTIEGKDTGAITGSGTLVAIGEYGGIKVTGAFDSYAQLIGFGKEGTGVDYSGSTYGFYVIGTGGSKGVSFKASDTARIIGVSDSGTGVCIVNNESVPTSGFITAYSKDGVGLSVADKATIDTGKNPDSCISVYGTFAFSEAEDIHIPVGAFYLYSLSGNPYKGVISIGDKFEAAYGTALDGAYAPLTKAEQEDEDFFDDVVKLYIRESSGGSDVNIERFNVGETEIFADKDDSGENGWSWNSAAKTLTLYGTKLESPPEDFGEMAAGSITLPAGSTIELIGYNEVDSLVGAGALTLRRAGILKAVEDSTDTGLIEVYGALSIEDSTVFADDIRSYGDLSVSGGYVETNGISAMGDAAIDGAYVKTMTVLLETFTGAGTLTIDSGFIDCEWIDGNLINNGGVVKAISTSGSAVTGDIIASGGVCVLKGSTVDEYSSNPAFNMVLDLFNNERPYVWSNGDLVPIDEVGENDYSLQTIIIAKAVYIVPPDDLTELDGVYISSEASTVLKDGTTVTGGSYIEKTNANEAAVSAGSITGSGTLVAEGGSSAIFANGTISGSPLLIGAGSSFGIKYTGGSTKLNMIGTGSEVGVYAPTIGTGSRLIGISGDGCAVKCVTLTGGVVTAYSNGDDGVFTADINIARTVESASAQLHVYGQITTPKIIINTGLIGAYSADTPLFSTLDYNFNSIRCFKSENLNANFTDFTVGNLDSIAKLYAHDPNPPTPTPVVPVSEPEAEVNIVFDVPYKTVYAISKGANPKVYLDDLKNSDLEISSRHDTLEKVFIDDNELSKNDYLSGVNVSGKTTMSITLKASFLETLAPGEYQLRFEFTNGYAETRLCVYKTNDLAPEHAISLND